MGVCGSTACGVKAYIESVLYACTGLLFLRYAYSRYKMVEEEILKDRPVRNGRKMPVEASDFTAKRALFLPEMAQFDYLVNLPEKCCFFGTIECIRTDLGGAWVKW